MTIKFHNVNLEDIKNLAIQIAKHLGIADVIALQGDLGAGKTTFSSFLINALLSEQTVITSPTFNLVHSYPYQQGNIWHFDLYRLKEKDEIFYLGIDEAFEYGISIIEWPEIIFDLLPSQTIYIEIKCLKDNLRDITIKNVNFELDNIS